MDPAYSPAAVPQHTDLFKVHQQKILPPYAITFSNFACAKCVYLGILL